MQYAVNKLIYIYIYIYKHVIVYTYIYNLKHPTCRGHPITRDIQPQTGICLKQQPERDGVSSSQWATALSWFLGTSNRSGLWVKHGRLPIPSSKEITAVALCKGCGSCGLSTMTGTWWWWKLCKSRMTRHGHLLQCVAHLVWGYTYDCKHVANMLIFHSYFKLAGLCFACLIWYNMVWYGMVALCHVENNK